MLRLRRTGYRTLAQYCYLLPIDWLLEHSVRQVLESHMSHPYRIHPSRAISQPTTCWCTSTLWWCPKHLIRRAHMEKPDVGQMIENYSSKISHLEPYLQREERNAALRKGHHYESANSIQRSETLKAFPVKSAANQFLTMFSANSMIFINQDARYYVFNRCNENLTHFLPMQFSFSYTCRDDRHLNPWPPPSLSLSLSLSADPWLNPSMHKPKMSTSYLCASELRADDHISTDWTQNWKTSLVCVQLHIKGLGRLLFHSQLKSGEVSRIKDHSLLKIRVNPSMHKPHVYALCTCKLRADDHISTGWMQI